MGLDGIVIGFDFGLRRIGTAIGQTVTCTATPGPILLAEVGEPRWSELEQLIAKWHPQAFVVGVPVNLDDSEQAITQAARNFIEKLKHHFALPIYEAEERLTTKEARAEIFARGGYKSLQKDAIDSVAAQIILEAWLRQNCDC